MAVNAPLMQELSQDVGSLQSLSAEDFLRTVGRRVRQHRSRSRMSRKRLAELSGVSERYLAQLESGQGNMSIILLRRVSMAIALPLDVLMSDDGPVAHAPMPQSVVDVHKEPGDRGVLHGTSAVRQIHESPVHDAADDCVREPELAE